eukprot:scaffold6124_cov86-Skeletonema_dohrnii-CCMP3373.AAC.2
MSNYVVRALRTAAGGGCRESIRLKQTLCMQINHLITIILDPFSGIILCLCDPRSPGDEGTILRLREHSITSSN